MRVLQIHALRPAVSKTEALRAFNSPGAASLYWRVRRGPLQRIADVYVPFFINRVSYRVGSASRSRTFGIDAVDGSLDLFEFPSLPCKDDLAAIETRNRLQPLLSAGRAQDLLREKVWRLIFQQGFFKLRQPKLEVNSETTIVHIPYWLGFYGWETAHCRVLDAVRRRIEGAKAAAFFEEWLAL